MKYEIEDNYWKFMFCKTKETHSQSLPYSHRKKLRNILRGLGNGKIFEPYKAIEWRIKEEQND